MWVLIVNWLCRQKSTMSLWRMRFAECVLCSLHSVRYMGDNSCLLSQLLSRIIIYYVHISTHIYKCISGKSSMMKIIRKNWRQIRWILKFYHCLHINLWVSYLLTCIYCIAGMRILADSQGAMRKQWNIFGYCLKSKQGCENITYLSLS